LIYALKKFLDTNNNVRLYKHFNLLEHKKLNNNFF
jgi:hypothetical protein